MPPNSATPDHRNADEDNPTRATQKTSPRLHNRKTSGVGSHVRQAEGRQQDKSIKTLTEKYCSRKR